MPDSTGKNKNRMIIIGVIIAGVVVVAALTAILIISLLRITADTDETDGKAAGFSTETLKPLLTAYGTKNGDDIHYKAAAADMDGDGVKEVFVGEYRRKTIFHSEENILSKTDLVLDSEKEKFYEDSAEAGCYPIVPNKIVAVMKYNAASEKWMEKRIDFSGYAYESNEIQGQPMTSYVIYENGIIRTRFFDSYRIFDINKQKLYEGSFSREDESLSEADRKKAGDEYAALTKGKSAALFWEETDINPDVLMTGEREKEDLEYALETYQEIVDRMVSFYTPTERVFVGNEENYSNITSWYLLNMDGDGIPELFLTGNNHLNMGHLFVWRDGEIKCFEILNSYGEDLFYDGGIIYATYGNRGIGWDKIFKYENGAVTLLGRGDFREKVKNDEITFKYKWNGNSVSEKEYARILKDTRNPGENPVKLTRTRVYEGNWSLDSACTVKQAFSEMCTPKEADKKYEAAQKKQEEVDSAEEAYSDGDDEEDDSGDGEDSDDEDDSGDDSSSENVMTNDDFCDKFANVVESLYRYGTSVGLAANSVESIERERSGFSDYFVSDYDNSDIDLVCVYNPMKFHDWMDQTNSYDYSINVNCLESNISGGSLSYGSDFSDEVHLKLEWKVHETKEHDSSYSQKSSGTLQVCYVLEDGSWKIKKMGGLLILKYDPIN